MRSWLGLALWLVIGFGVTGLLALALQNAHTVPQQAHDLRDVRSAESPP